jgi:hypothetical protein
MEDPRTEAARANDDSDLIDNAEPGPAQATSSGGNLARDVASKAEEALITDSAGVTRVTKQDDIEHGTEVRPDRARAAD